jgi:hypothetical protein
MNRGKIYADGARLYVHELVMWQKLGIIFGRLGEARHFKRGERSLVALAPMARRGTTSDVIVVDEFMPLVYDLALERHRAKYEGMALLGTLRSA